VESAAPSGQLQTMQKIGSLLDMSSGGEDGAVINKPGCEIGRVIVAGLTVGSCSALPFGDAEQRRLLISPCRRPVDGRSPILYNSYNAG
jgi:hypothetical protein